jgi:hypothetical protein
VIRRALSVFTATLLVPTALAAQQNCPTHASLAIGVRVATNDGITREVRKSPLDASMVEVIEMRHNIGGSSELKCTIADGLVIINCTQTATSDGGNTVHETTLNYEYQRERPRLKIAPGDTTVVSFRTTGTTRVTKGATETPERKSEGRETRTIIAQPAEQAVIAGCSFQVIPLEINGVSEGPQGFTTTGVFYYAPELGMSLLRTVRVEYRDGRPPLNQTSNVIEFK